MEEESPEKLRTNHFQSGIGERWSRYFTHNVTAHNEEMIPTKRERSNLRDSQEDSPGELEEEGEDTQI